MSISISPSVRVHHPDLSLWQSIVAETAEALLMQQPNGPELVQKFIDANDHFVQTAFAKEPRFEGNRQRPGRILHAPLFHLVRAPDVRRREVGFIPGGKTG